MHFSQKNSKSLSSVTSSEVVNVNLKAAQTEFEETFNTEDLQCLSVSSTEHPVEQADWIGVNEQLRKRGFAPILLTHPKSHSDREVYNIFNEESSSVLRKTILHLLQENEKRQALINELKQPKTRKNQTSANDSHKEESSDLIEKPRSKWDFNVPTIKGNDEIKKTKRSQLEYKYEERIEYLQKEIDELRESLKQTRLGEKEQVQDKVWSNLAHRSSRKTSGRSQPNTARSKESQETNPSLTDCFQTETSIVKRYKKKCAALKSKIHLMKIENNQLHHRICVLENSRQAWRSDSSRAQKPKELYEVIGGKTQVDCIKKIELLRFSAEYSKEIEKLLEKVNELVTGEAIPSMDILDTRINLLTSIMLWKADRDELKALFSSVKKLSTLLPCEDAESIKCNDNSTVYDINQFVQKLCEKMYKGPIGACGSSLSEEQMRSTLYQFMRLFDVKSIGSVYTRMYDVYVKYFEMVNALNSVREILHLEKDSTLNFVVNAIGKLSKAKHLLHVRKLDSVIKRVEEYDKFYEVFHGVMTELMKILGVERIDAIIPTVKTIVEM